MWLGLHRPFQGRRVGRIFFFFFFNDAKFELCDLKTPQKVVFDNFFHSKFANIDNNVSVSNKKCRVGDIWIKKFGSVG